MTIIPKLEFFLLPQPSTTVFTGRVDGAPASPYVEIGYDAGVTGSFGNPLPGQSVWFGSTAGGQERGVRRLRSFPGTASGTLEIDESDDVGPLIQDNDYITIKWDFRLWPKYPRFGQSGTNVIIYEDYDIAYTNQTLQWRPVAVAGPPGVAFLAAGQAQLSFVGDRSYAQASGASISAYLWTAWDSVEGTSASQGTEGSPVTFTWTAPGWHLVSLRVTDSNGNNHTNYTWAVVVDPASPTDVAYLDYDAHTDYTDFNHGGGQASFTVHAAASTSAFPNEGLILHAARGSITTATASWPFRTNVLFVGWILEDTVRQDSESGDVSFRAGTIDAIMRNTTLFPVSLTSKTTPTNWTQAANLTVDRAASFLYHYRSTLDNMGWIVPSNFSGLIQRQTFGPGNLFTQLQSQLMASILGKIACTHQSVLYHVIDYNVQNAAERAAATTRKMLHKGVWMDDVSIDERHDYEWPVNQVKASGIYYPGGDVEDICPLFSEAPGDAPKSYGGEAPYDRLILLSQSDLNVRSGHLLAKLNQRYPIYRMQFVNDGSFGVAPQDLFPANIEATDNRRGLSYTGNLIARRVSRTYNHEGGYFVVSVDFEPESSGQPGVTVDMPCGPPDQELPGTPQPPPAGVPGLTALVAGTTGTSFYYAPGVAQAWDRRVFGLSDPDQLGFQDVIPDLWSYFKQGYNPEQRILWGAGLGFLVRTKDTGKDWKDRSAYLTPTPAWPGETSPALASLTPFELLTDIFNEDYLYVLARWQYTGTWHGAIGKTTDGYTYTWHNMTGSAQVEPLGMAINRGNGGTLWVTTWESDPTGTLYLKKFNTLDMSLAASYALGVASSAQVSARDRFAHPATRLGQLNEVFVYGNMLAPQGFTGTVHVMRNTGAGVTGSYSVIENTWGTDFCGTFGADEAGNYYAVRVE